MTSSELAATLAGHRAGAQPDSVEAIVAQLLPAARAASDSALMQLLLLERGKTRIAYGSATEGEPDLREAYTLAVDRKDGTTVHAALRYLSEASQQRGRTQEAVAFLEELEQRARAADDAFHVGKALYGLGRLRYRARNLSAADSLLTAALPYLSAADDSAGLAAAHNSLGNALGARGAYRDAGAHYALAAVFAFSGGSLSLEAMARNNLAGVAMIVGDPATAVTEYRRARDIQLQRGLKHQVGAPWRNLSQALIDLGLFSEADAELTEALAFCRAHGFRAEEALTLMRLAGLELAQGKGHEALAWSREAIAIGCAISIETCVTARLRAADALLQLGRQDEAWAELDSTEAIIDREDYTFSMLLAQSRARTLRAMGHHHQVIEALRPALARSAKAQIPRHRMPLQVVAAASWFDLGDIDSTRAHLDIAESLWEQERALPTDPAWRELRGVEAQQLFALRVALALQEGDLDRAFAAAQRYKARTLIERILGPGADLLPVAEAPPWTTIRSFQEDVLRPGELFLDMLSGPGGGWLFAVTPDTCLARPLPGDAVWKQLLDPLLAQLAHPFGDFDSQRADEVFGALTGPASESQEEPSIPGLITRAATILVSPDGLLHRIPFAVVIPKDDIRRVPSAAILAHLRKQQRSETNTAGRILAIAGQANDAHDRLKGAELEVQRLKQRFRHVEEPGTAVLRQREGDGFDPSSYDLIHIACHTEIDVQRPWNSAMSFGTVQDPMTVRAGDIARLVLTAQLAVLSSCGSAEGRILPGEGVQGLAAGFLSAGVPAVLATLWPVDDATTAQLMDAFYAELARGATPAAALSAARARLRADKATEHPFFWAGFVMLGDGDAHLNLQNRRRFDIRLVSALIFVAAMAPVVYRRMRLLRCQADRR